MASITVGGKGSKSRVRNRPQYRENHDGIKWRSKSGLGDREKPLNNCCVEKGCQQDRDPGAEPCCCKAESSLGSEPGYPVLELKDIGSIYGRDDRTGLGVEFQCQCSPGCHERVRAAFQDPLDGGCPDSSQNVRWKHTGKTVEDLTVTPSIRHRHIRVGGGTSACHVIIRAGTVTVLPW